MTGSIHGFVPVSAGLAGSLLGPTTIVHVRHQPERTVVVRMTAWHAGDVEQVCANVQAIDAQGEISNLHDVAFADAPKAPSGTTAPMLLHPPEQGDNRRKALLERIDTLLKS